MVRSGAANRAGILIIMKADVVNLVSAGIGTLSLVSTYYTFRKHAKTQKRLGKTYSLLKVAVCMGLVSFGTTFFKSLDDHAKEQRQKKEFGEYAAERVAEILNSRTGHSEAVNSADLKLFFDNASKLRQGSLETQKEALSHILEQYLARQANTPPETLEELNRLQRSASQLWQIHTNMLHAALDIQARMQSSNALSSRQELQLFATRVDDYHKNLARLQPCGVEFAIKEAEASAPDASVETPASGGPTAPQTLRPQEFPSPLPTGYSPPKQLKAGPTPPATGLKSELPRNGNLPATPRATNSPVTTPLIQPYPPQNLHVTNSN